MKRSLIPGKKRKFHQNFLFQLMPFRACATSLSSFEKNDTINRFSQVVAKQAIGIAEIFPAPAIPAAYAAAHAVGKDYAAAIFRAIPAAAVMGTPSFVINSNTSAEAARNLTITAFQKDCQALIEGISPSALVQQPIWLHLLRKSGGMVGGFIKGMNHDEKDITKIGRT